MKKIILIGNPNVGKSTLFNRLTCQKQKTANWPGKTVEIKEGQCPHKNSTLTIVDLPGVYSLNPNSAEEVVANQYLEKNPNDVVIQIADSTNLKRNLYLTTQLIQKKVPLILALNFSDVSDAKHISINEKKLCEQLGIKIIKISAKTSSGLNVLLDAATNSPSPSTKKFSAPTPKQRYELIDKLADGCISTPKSVGKTTERVDSILTNKYLALPIFLIIMYSIFQLTFTLAAPITDALDESISTLSEFCAQTANSLSFPSWAISLITDGIFAGVGSIIIFLPNILILFFLLSILEDSGYFARIALIMDPIMQKVGLEGKAFMPLILGFGCNVPAIMATRIVEDQKERLISILINPFMSCSARLPIYILFAAIFFPNNQGLALFIIYLLGILVAFASARLFRFILKSKNPPSLLIELPPYRIPTFTNIVKNTLDKAVIFIKKAGYVILSISLFIWFLASMPYGVEYASKDSYIGQLGQLVAPLFTPAGFGNWEASVSLILGSVAKEVVVSSLATLYGAEGDALNTAIAQHFTPLSAAAFMVFSLIYMPCIATVAIIKKETASTKWALFSVVYSLALAWLLATLVFQIGNFLGF